MAESPSPTTVFDIPLIRDRIAHNLAMQDLRNCASVSWTWNTHFKAYLWRVINVRKLSDLNKLMAPKMQAELHEHAHRIQEVNSNRAEIWSFFRTCPVPNLATLRSHCAKNWPANQAANRYLRDLIALMDANPNLRTLELGHFDYKAVEDPMLKAIQRHNGLCHVKILRDDNVGFSKLEHVLWAMYHLETVHLATSGCNDGTGRRARLTGRETVSELTGDPNPVCMLKALHCTGKLSDNSPHTFLHFLKSCPQLEQLAPPQFHPKSNYYQLSGIIASHLPHLQHLDMRKTEMSGRVMARTVRACRGLRSFVSAHQQQDPAVVVDALLKHRGTLEELDLVGTDVDGRLLHSLLCACAHLQKLVAMAAEKRKVYESNGDPVLTGKEMEEAGSSWACTNLKVLAIRYEHGPDTGQRFDFDNGALGVGEEKKSTPILPGVLVRELIRLTQLEELRLGRVTYRITHTTYGSLSMMTWVEHSNTGQWPALQGGHRTVAAMLYALAGLKKLRMLELRNLKEFVGEHVLQEMGKKWEGIKIEKS